MCTCVSRYGFFFFFVGMIEWETHTCTDSDACVRMALADSFTAVLEAPCMAALILDEEPSASTDRPAQTTVSPGTFPYP